MAEPNENPSSQSGAGMPGKPHALQFSRDAAPRTFQERSHAIFLGPEGLRAGWRLLVYLFLVATLFFIAQVILNSLHSLGSLRLIFVDKVLFVLEVTVPAFFLARMEQRPFSAYGLAARGILRGNFWIGLLWGIGSVTLLILLLRACHAYDFNGLAIHGQRLVKFALFWTAFFLLVALSEEFLLRGYTQFTLSGAIGFWPAAVLLSLMFGAIHIGNEGENWMGLLGVSIVGFFFCLTLRRTGNLWFAIGFHAAWDWGESYLYAVPDSGTIVPGHLLRATLHGSRFITGGTVGPEGSVLLLVVMAVTWIAFDRTHRQVNYPPTRSNAPCN